MKKKLKLELIDGLVVKIQKNEANKLRGGKVIKKQNVSVNTRFTELANCCDPAPNSTEFCPTINRV